MNKNALLGLLAGVIIIGGGYLLIRNNQRAPVADQPANTTPQTPSGQEPGTNPGGTAPSDTPGLPTVITQQQSATSNSTAVLMGQVRPNGAVTTYWFNFGLTQALSSKSAEQAIGSGYTLINAPAYIGGLQANTQYYFRLSARNSYGTVSGQVYTFKTNSNPPPQGTAPSVHTAAATSITRTSATIAGSIDPNESSTNYWFEYGTSTSFGSVSSIRTLGSVSANANVSGGLSDLSPLTKYYFRLNAQNQYGTVIGQTLSFTTNGPVSPSAPIVNTTAATNVTNNTARLNGRINPDGAETTYWFEYSSDSLLGSIIGSGTARETVAAGTSNVSVSANISGLQKNSTYYYRLVARNSEGTIRGDIVSLKTKNN